MKPTAELFFIFAALMLAVAAGFGVWGVEHLEGASMAEWMLAVGIGVGLGVAASAALVWQETKTRGRVARGSSFSRNFWIGVMVIATLRALEYLTEGWIPDWLKAGGTFGAGVACVAAAALSIVRFTRWRRESADATQPSLPLPPPPPQGGNRADVSGLP